ncbi:MAG: response regulator [Dokdonella sp.]
MDKPSARLTNRWRVWLHNQRAWLWISAPMMLAAVAAPLYARAPLAWFVSGFWLLTLVAGWFWLPRSLKEEPADRAIPLPATVAAPASPAAVEKEVLALRELRDELITARQAAEAANMAKGEFLATMSHEIRTPLNGIVPLLDLLRSTPLNLEQEDYLATAQQSAHELLRIVDDILDYSKLEAERVELESVGINLKELLESVAQLMQGSAAAKGLRLSVVIDPAVRLAVRDSGVGVSADAIARLFQPFSQADASTTRLYGGTGLGLVICKRLIDLMQGQIGVNSAAGRGAEFWFEVPLLKAVGDRRVRRSLDGLRVLLVSEDVEFNRRLQHLLEPLGIHVSSSARAAEALTQLRGGGGGNRWGHELLLLDTLSGRQAATALLHNVLRDPSLDRLRVLLHGNPPESASVAATNRLLSLPTEFTPAQLRASLLGLFAIEDAPSEIKPADSVDQSRQALPDAELSLRGRVLLVEDHPVNLKVASRLLQRLGLQVDHAENGREALRLARQHTYQAILMDCQMPVMDGYAATQAWRDHEARHAQPRVPIIAMTANAMLGDRERCMAAGMDDYLTKPLDRRLLADTLRRWLGTPDPAPGGTTTQLSAHRASAHEHAPNRSAAPHPPAAALDAGILSELVEAMGSDFVELVDVYLRSTQQQLLELRSASANADDERCASIVHSLKSASANLGALSLAGLAGSAERGHRNNQAIAWGDTVSTLESEFARVADALAAATHLDAAQP